MSSEKYCFIHGLKTKHVMCADKSGDFNLVNYTYSSGVYHEQKTKDLHSRIQS